MNITDKKDYNNIYKYTVTNKRIVYRTDIATIVEGREFDGSTVYILDSKSPEETYIVNKSELLFYIDMQIERLEENNDSGTDQELGTWKELFEIAKKYKN